MRITCTKIKTSDVPPPIGVELFLEDRLDNEVALRCRVRYPPGFESEERTYTIAVISTSGMRLVGCVGKAVGEFIRMSDALSGSVHVYVPGREE